MAVKTITVTVDAYESIKRMKSDEESFSELFLRIGQRQLTAKDIIGVLNDTPEEAKAFSERVRNLRKELNEDFARRDNYVRNRLKHIN